MLSIDKTPHSKLNWKKNGTKNFCVGKNIRKMTMSIWNVIRTKYLDVLFDAYIMKLEINVEIKYKSKSRLIKLYYLFMTFCKYFSYKYFISNFYLGLCVHSLLQLYFLRQIGKFKISSVVCCSPCIWRFKETMIEILVSVIIY